MEHRPKLNDIQRQMTTKDKWYPKTNYIQRQMETKDNWYPKTNDIKWQMTPNDKPHPLTPTYISSPAHWHPPSTKPDNLLPTNSRLRLPDDLPAACPEPPTPYTTCSPHDADPTALWVVYHNHIRRAIRGRLSGPVKKPRTGANWSIKI